MFLMMRQLVGRVVGLAARVGALVRLLPGVRVDVHLELGPRHEQSSAVGAGVLAVLVVDPGMVLHVDLGLEHLAALLARVRGRAVDRVDVLLAVRLLLETHPAVLGINQSMKKMSERQTKAGNLAKRDLPPASCT